ncbi:tetratricopeptide repeat protein [Bacillus subtilis]|uniref:response regulator aspartate phosphatase n=1 Tax=Bacillus subtilis TaxID=1423 RepID=UPI000EF16B30|nr:tetratricopeptide repeat protein [Bacillus subtilis]AYK76642.1 tetratricopeptide repeat protein [Bacillus subtilis subsp. subtilis]AYL03272.1 tetratricopeptide repeat protein [Bacillus subtilis subsp. subtilis]MEC0327584.1 tetratricopeptide repeat protein [Bacillus subtilis]MEC0398637.1 tetratricopeptide repeat protein [Bacillus subtilis]MEC0415031.1 tetratricopeptide repeat protein [Bacillus subtilis]
MKQLISSSKVGVKINEWYKYIRMFSVPDAELIKAEVEQELNNMKEDQDLLLYYSLMCFRHQLMLEYLEPKTMNEERPKISDLLEKIESNQADLKGILEYYFNFFRGMYEFEEYEYLKAITFYKQAEKKLSLVADEIERAEFHYKIAEVYYHMKQTHMSMHHIVQAIETYRAHETYTVREIQCSFVMGLNYLDMEYPEKALPHFKNALENAKNVEIFRLQGVSLYNIGLSYFASDDFEKATEYFGQSLAIYEERYENTNRLLDPLIMLTKTKFKLKASEATSLCERGLFLSQKLNDEILYHEFRFLKALYNQGSITELGNILTYLEEKMMLPDVEDLATDAAKYYKENEDHKAAGVFFEKVLYAQKHIQRGDCLYEY